jgi:DeoR/GlpR family transcriptional regulator of sugar metabolism
VKLHKPAPFHEETYIIDFDHKSWHQFLMRVPDHLVKARRDRLAQLLGQHRYLPVQELCRLLGVSEATARRDLAALVREKKVTRTYGGALSEFNDRFPSFRERQLHVPSAKAKIARQALALIQPGKTYFFDSGTTVFAIAEAFRDNPVSPVSIVTSNLPAGEALAGIPDVQVFQLAGQLFLRQSVLLGEIAQKSLEFWHFDLVFLSAEAMNSEGIWNSQSDLVQQQRAVLRRSGKAVFCLDSTKLNGNAPHFLVPWSEVDALLTDASAARLKKAGITLAEGQLLGANQPPSSAPRVREESPPLPIHFL